MKSVPPVVPPVVVAEVEKEARVATTVALVVASVAMEATVVKVGKEEKEEVVLSSFKNVRLSVPFLHHPVIPVHTVKDMENTVVVAVPVMILRSVWHREHLVPAVVVPVIPVPFALDLEFPVPVVVVPVIPVLSVRDLAFPVPVVVVPDRNLNSVVTKISTLCPERVATVAREEKEARVARVVTTVVLQPVDTTVVSVLQAMMRSVLLVSVMMHSVLLVSVVTTEATAVREVKEEKVAREVAVVAFRSMKR